MNSPLPPPGLEPTLYFFSNSLTVIAIAGLVFFVLGLWFGYLTWGKFKRRARAFLEETNLLRLEIAKLKRRIAEDVVAPAPVAAPAPLLGLTSEPEMIVLEQAPAPSELPAPAEPAKEADPAPEPEAAPLKETLAAIVGVTPIIPALPDPVAPLSAVVASEEPAPVVIKEEPVQPVEPPAPVVPQTESIVPVEIKTAPVEDPAPVVVVTHDASPPEPVPAQGLVELAVSPLPPEPSPVEPAPVPEPAPTIPLATVEEAVPTQPSELAARLFADELKNGGVRWDGRMGIVYGDRPDRWDDLTLMRGVAELTQQRLHDFGIYTFKQIAAWDERVIREVGIAIHAKDRIGRERWSQQARDLHYLKYGEKIS